MDKLWCFGDSYCEVDANWIYTIRKSLNLKLGSVGEGGSSLLVKCYDIPTGGFKQNEYYRDYGWWGTEAGLWDLTNSTYCRIKWKPQDGAPNAFTHPAIIPNSRLDSESWQFDNLSSTTYDLVNPMLTPGVANVASLVL